MFAGTGFNGSGSSWMNVSQLEVLVTTACDPSQADPNYARHLEVAEYINQKKANTPRECAMLLARLANHRNPHIGHLALALLDTLVQSCGYPFHLQISTKEFLNELVRRFPERPPPFPGLVMQGILNLIHQWTETICKESRWKQDLGNIRDMHRLLTFKGYRFRQNAPSTTASATQASTSALKSAAELEEEDRTAQSAKLQELIRRGTPRDLAAAQELMKSLAGANPDAKPDYRSQALTELNKLEQKVILLNELLDNFDVERGEVFAQGDAYDQIATILSDARPKIQKWISDAEADDPESLDTYLQINDQLNSVLERYDAFKAGDYAAARNPVPAEVAAAQNATSLIDFDDFASAPASSNGGGGGGNGADDLASLFSSAPQQQQQQQNAALSSLFDARATSGSPLPSSGPTPSPQPGSGASMPFGSIMLPGTPNPSGASAPRAFSMGGMGAGAGNGAMGLGGMQMQPQQAQMGAGMGMGGAGFGGSQNQQQGAPAQQASQPRPQQQQAQAGKDPFADLAGLF